MSNVDKIASKIVAEKTINKAVKEHVVWALRTLRDVEDSVNGIDFKFLENHDNNDVKMEAKQLRPACANLRHRLENLKEALNS